MEKIWKKVAEASAMEKDIALKAVLEHDLLSKVEISHDSPLTDETALILLRFSKQFRLTVGETVEGSPNHIDDLTMTNDEPEVLLKLFIGCLLRAKMYNAFFKPSKTKIGTRETNTLGYVASEEGYLSSTGQACGEVNQHAFPDDRVGNENIPRARQLSKRLHNSLC